MSSQPILEVELTHQIHAGITLDVAFTVSHECVIVFGQSGAGKSTLLRLIAGLIRPDSGRIRLGGELIFDSTQKRNTPLRSRGIGLIYQEDLLFPHLNVAANIGFGLRGRPRTEVDARVAEIAKLCEVSRLLDRDPETLSGGERQRVGLARALAPRPRLLLCDEPVSALDLEGRHALIARLTEVRRHEGIPMLHVTHSPTEAITLGSRMLVMEAGKIIDNGDPVQVLGRHGSTAFADWSGARNIFTAMVESHSANESQICVEGGPMLVVPKLLASSGTRRVVAIRADDILLSRSRVEGLSARNQIQGQVEQIVEHGDECEVLVRTGEAIWVVSIMPAAVASLGLNPGAEVFMIFKARGCHVLDTSA